MAGARGHRREPGRAVAPPGALAIAIVLALAGCGSGSATHEAAAPGDVNLRYQVPSTAMLPGLKPGVTVLVDPGAYRTHLPAIGDVVLVHPPTGAVTLSGSQCGVQPQAGQPCGKPTAHVSSVNFIKRIVGGPGDEIALVQGHVVRNGQQQPEPFVIGCSGSALACNFPSPVRVPRGYWYVLGDNRGNSDDSRFWGPVLTTWIVGKVVGTAH